MPKNKSASKTQKENYSKYKSEKKHEKNKIKKLENHLHKAPNDKQAAKALENFLKSGVKYTRNRKAIKPNSTVQKRIRRISGYSTTQNTFYAEIIPNTNTISSEHSKRK